MMLRFPLISRLVFAVLVLVMFSGCASQRHRDFVFVPTYEHDLIADIEGRRHSAMYDAARYDHDQMRIVGQRYSYSQPRAVIYDSTITTGVYTTDTYYHSGSSYYRSGCQVIYPSGYYGGGYGHGGYGGINFNAHHGHGHFGSHGSRIHGHFGGNPSVHFNFGGGGYCP